MTQDELQEQIERAVMGFSSIDGLTESLAEQLVGEGFLSYDDLSVIEPEDLIAMSEGLEDMETLTEEKVDEIVTEAESRAEEAEKAAAEERRRQRELDRIEKERQAAEEAAGVAAGTTEDDGPAEAEPSGDDTEPTNGADPPAAETESQVPSTEGAADGETT